MSSIAISQDSRLRDWRFVAIEGTLLLIMVGIAVSAIWWLPAAKREDARNAITRHNQQVHLIRTIRAAGFKSFDGNTYQLLVDNGQYYTYGFYYAVGSCWLPISVDGADRPYIYLTQTDGTINITYRSLKSLPQTKYCFRE